MSRASEAWITNTASMRLRGTVYRQLCDCTTRGELLVHSGGQSLLLLFPDARTLTKMSNASVDEAFFSSFCL